MPTTLIQLEAALLASSARKLGVVVLSVTIVRPAGPGAVTGSLSRAWLNVTS